MVSNPLFKLADSLYVDKKYDTEDLPQKPLGKFNVEPELVPVNVRTLASLNEMVVVADCPNSRLTDSPAVPPPRLMGPEALSVIYELHMAVCLIGQVGLVTGLTA